MYKGQAGFQWAPQDVGLSSVDPRTCSTRSRCSFAFRKMCLCIGLRQSLSEIQPLVLG